MLRRDGIAGAAMPAADPVEAYPAEPDTRPAPVFVVPEASTVGAVGVPSGFPRTPAGAVGQLAAIEVAVLQAMSIDYTRDVYQAWAWPGSPDPAGWSLTGHVQTFLGAAQMGAEKDPGVAVTVRPAAAQVKGVDGPGWVLACVLVEIRAVVAVEARAGYGHCERMQWHRGPVADRPRPRGRRGAVDVAGQPGRGPVRLADLGPSGPGPVNRPW